jgi:hypothetical protein
MLFFGTNFRYFSPFFLPNSLFKSRDLVVFRPFLERAYSPAFLSIHQIIRACSHPSKECHPVVGGRAFSP